MSSAIGVLIVDDSPTVRAVLRRLVTANEDLWVVGEAADGEEAVASVATLHPQVILMDVEMPRMDGVQATHAITRTYPTPIIVITSRADQREVRSAFRCFAAGAVELLAKPDHPKAWDELARRLPVLIRTLAHRRQLEAGEPGAAPWAPPAGVSRGVLCIAVGASTGGPAALHQFLAAFSRPLLAPVLVVQHISTGFETGLAEWLASVTGLDVQLARHGEPLRPDVVRLAPAHHHLRLRPDHRLELDGVTPPRGGHRPSVDELFASCIATAPAHTVGVLLSGMGRDGAEELVRLHRCGGLALVQEANSCAVFGMPRAALELEPTIPALPPASLAAAVEAFARSQERP